MCIIGYDEKMEGGAFQIMNSWGSAWGEGGIAWMRYDDFLYYNLEAYAMEPLPDRNCNATNIVKSGGINSNETSGRLEFTIGLLNDDTKQYDPLNKEGEIFSTPMKKGEKKYKVEIDNSGAGYFYVFKQDNGPDMRANVLFPDVVNYSPYFGLSGRRTVPVNQPLMVKSINEPDNHSYYLIIVATQKPIDYNNVCSAIGKNMFFAYVTPFSENVINALSGKLKIAKNVQYQSENGKIKVSADIKDQGDVFMIIKIADMGI